MPGTGGVERGSTAEADDDLGAVVSGVIDVAIEFRELDVVGGHHGHGCWNLVCNR